MTLAEINDELGAARTNKKEFLEKLEAIIPWETFLELIQPSYYKGELGNKPYPLELMLRIFILQNVYNLADMAVMNEVIDSRAFSNFCTSRHISKRGSAALRKVLFQITEVFILNKPENEPVYQFIDKKRAEGKHYYSYRIAAANKFLRIYYAKVNQVLNSQ